MDLPIITAHSGCEKTLANSMENIKKAIQLNVEYVEIDVRHTKDHIAVLSHDDEIGGICISESNLNELKKYNIVTYEEAVDLIIKSGKKVNSDIKTMESIELISTYIMNNELCEKVILSGCKEKEISYLTENYPEIRKLFNIDILMEEDLSFEEKMNRTIMLHRQNHLQGVNIPYYQLSDEVLQIMKDQGIETYVWTIDTEELMRRFVNKGVKSITTNEVVLLEKVKNEEAFR
ncbi:glycerophosphodiester phosphodiesterase [Vallitalea okinawensis]|uniref:glycerophosphodiester phosphodiesterase n=1 Tax=Vallitalea okinawensis TaxID=2078660 RepID=UPI000CFC49CB|nr:glycerophosphodiester phosphodiesterase [Vallitalea okinawensis]